ncbi:MAG: T9SS type A sorting domain-containing protein [Flavobacteriales bacterium]|nr:T9SS type A sorting domain-containing protein [Flavobacteriales bacterium]
MRNTIRQLALMSLLATVPLGLSAQSDCLNQDQFPFDVYQADPTGATVSISTCIYLQEYTHFDGIVAGASYEFTITGNGFMTLRTGAVDGPVVATGTASLIYEATSSDDIFVHYNVDDACTQSTGCQTNTIRLLLNCTQPSYTYTVSADCDNLEYFVNLTITDLGDADELYLINSAGIPEDVADQPGDYQLGPFATLEGLTITLEHSNDLLCSVTLPALQNPVCAIPIVCGAPALEETFCYGPNENRAWSYAANGSGTLRLRFLRGTIESSTWDRIRIFDGSDNTAPLAFAHTTFLTYNLGPAGSAINNTLTDYYGVEVYSTSGSIYMELESDGSVSCGGPFPTATFDAWEWEVVCLDCTVPQASAEAVDDCANAQFSVPVTITSTGDGAVVDLIYTVDGGAPTTLAGVSLGETVLGPFNLGEVVNVSVAHESNELCNISLGNYTDSGTCPVPVICGTPIVDDLCHGDNLNVSYFYQGTGTFPIALQFTGGSLETCCDRLFVYDGADITAPQLTPAGGVAGDLTGLLFISTNAEHRLTFRVTTDGSVSCVSGFQTQLEWTVDCLDCTQPEATFSIVQDCENEAYFIAVDVTSLGTDPEIDITNNGGAPALAITAPGTYQVGPFASGVPVQITLVNDANALCNVNSPVLVNPICPQIVCGQEPIAEEYCYEANENRAWSYALPGATGELHLTFIRGTIESVTWDALRIYDGSDASGTLLFEHNNFATWNLGPAGSAVNNALTDFYAVDVASTTGTLYMTLTSDGSVQCTSQPTYDPMEWEVYCVGCAAPGVTYNMTANCFDRTYKTEVIVTEAPSAGGLSITNTITNENIVANTVGVYAFGPYAQNAPSIYSLVDLDNPGCSYVTESMTYPSEDCVIRTCGFDNYEYCYENNDDRWYTFQAAAGVPITVGFLQGQMLAGDRIVLYNGFDENAAVLYQGNNNGNFTGFALNSQNPDNTITLRIQGNASGSCEDGQATIPLRWYVACGAVGIDEAGEGAFSLYPNPTNGLLYIELGEEVKGNFQVRVLDMSGRAVAEHQLAAQAGVKTMDLNSLSTGQYLVQVITENWVSTKQVQVAR